MTMTPDPPPQPSTILIVDDTAANLDLLGRILVDAGYRVRKLPSGELALASAQANPPDLILLDIRMPGLNGHEVCARLKQNPTTRAVPVIFISALHDTEDKVRAFVAGGVDYITKPFQVEEVLARVGTHLRLSTLQRRLEAQNRELERLASTDSLTGILNRRRFTEYGLHYLEHTNRYGRPFGLILYDIDEFKRVNDQYGHDLGDQVLMVTTERIRARLRSADLFARWGGEEFIILAPETPLDCLRQLAERLRQAFAATPIDPIGIITASFGIAVSVHDESLDALVRRADRALLAAKRAGRNQVRALSDAGDWER